MGDARREQDVSLSPEVWTRLVVVMEQMASRSDLPGVLQLIIDSMRDGLDAERASVLQYDHESEELFATSAHGVDRSLRFSADAGLAGAAIRAGEIINVADCYQDDRFNPEIDRQTGFHTRCMLTVPLASHDGTLEGVVQVLNKKNGPEAVFNHQDEMIARALSSQAAVALRRARLIEAERRKDQIEADLRVAREIQLATRPKQLPAPSGYEIAASAQSADETGGDAYDVFEAADGSIVVLMADASGHGIGPALSVARVHAMVRAAIGSGVPLEVTVPRINRYLHATVPIGQFVTAFIGTLDPATGILLYVAAGQAPIVRLGADGTRDVRNASAMPLAVDPTMKLTGPETLELSPGDFLLLLSDGYYERVRGTGQPFGLEGIVGFVEPHLADSAQIALDAIDVGVERDAGSARADDDQTAVVIRRVGGDGAGGTRR